MPTKKFVQTFVLLTMMPSAILWLHAQSSQNVPGIALDQLELHDVKAEAANYNGKPAVRKARRASRARDMLVVF